MSTDPGEQPPPAPEPPVTGHAAIDAALAAVDLGPDVHTHHAALAGALEVVQQALNRTPPQPVPLLPRP